MRFRTNLAAFLYGVCFLSLVGPMACSDNNQGIERGPDVGYDAGSDIGEQGDAPAIDDDADVGVEDDADPDVTSSNDAEVDVSGDDDVADFDVDPDDVELVLEGDFELRSVEDAAFLQDYSIVTGDLLIETVGVDSLLLPKLTRIGGHLRILDNATLTGIELPALSEVEAGVLIWSNAALESLSWPELTRIGGKLDAQFNAALHTLTLASLGSIEEALVVTDHSRLQHFSLPRLEHVHSLFWRLNSTTELSLPSLTRTVGSIRVSAGGALRQITLSGLEEVGGDVLFTQNANLLFISLDSLVDVAGGVEVKDNPRLAAVSFSALEEVAEGAAFDGNASLSQLELGALTVVGDELSVTWTSARQLYFPALNAVGHLRLHSNNNLEESSIGAATINGNLVVRDNPLLSGFLAPSLAEVGGNLHLKGGRLLDLDLRALATVGGELDLDNLHDLVALDLSDLSQAGSFYVGNTTALEEILLPELESVAGHFSVSDHHSLSAISLPALTHVAGDFLVNVNRVLGELSLPQLVDVGGRLEANRNPHVLDLTWPELQEVGGALVIERNTRLTEVALDALTRVGGELYLYNNNNQHTLSLPVLAYVDGVMTIYSMRDLTLLAAPSLQETGGLLIRNNNTLTSATFSTLEAVRRGGAFIAHSNGVLNQLHVPLLVELDDALNIYNNAQLPYCQVVEVRDRLQGLGWSGSTRLTGNLADECVEL